MTLRRLLFAVALLPSLVSPFIAATSGLLASVGAFYGGLVLAGLVAFWPLSTHERERSAHRTMAKNLSGSDPR